MNLIKTGFVLLLLSSFYPAHAAKTNDLDGPWMLTIEGKEWFHFGSERLSAGVVMNWETELRFEVVNGLWSQGSGKARIVGTEGGYSLPQGQFSCETVEGSFAGANGRITRTPNLRFQSFPLTGQVLDGRVEITPEMDWPGNFLATIFECTHEGEFGEFWFQRSPFVAKELGLKQSADLEKKEGVYKARVKEVRHIEPQGSLRLPLRDAWSLEWEDARLRRQVKMYLRHLKR